jgi:hypothetical protein
MQPMLNPSKVAETLDVPVSWVYDNWKAQGMPFVKIGQALRCRPEDLERWIASRTAA